MGRLAAHRADPKPRAAAESVAVTESPAGSPRQGFRGRTITTAVLLAAVLLAARLWLVEPVTVSSESMEPALPKGSTVLMFKPGPALGSPKAGDLVVFTSPEDGSPAVKRAIAFGGQTVAIEDSVLVVDGVPQAEPGIDHSRIDGTYFGPVTVPAGHVFVLGDNRAGSVDSRAYGSVALEALQATVLWPSGR
ncbi:signal peptidase I [Arthrobacter globiformis]|uniref:signal peptidase I n=1 Tax=Arthrobacter globiformis TaxID=1665 RepID=UPI001CB9A13F|nr:signal peptidase I [Arthrobacter globiformis]